MGLKKKLIQLIEGLEKKEFDELIKLYLQEEHGYKKIIITDGKDDVGLDVKVFDDNKSRKIQFQLTTQKSKTKADQYAFNRKVAEDLGKAQTNHKEYLYSNKLIYFYSYTLTPKQIRSWEKLADKDYDLDLDFIDANRLAEEIEDIPAIQDYLFSLIGVNSDKSIVGNNLLYDLISFGKPTEFKSQIIEAFILQLFLKADRLTFEEIKRAVNEKFKLDDGNDYYLKFVNSLLSNKIITKDKSDNKFLVTEEALDQLKKKSNDFLLERGLFRNHVENILKKYNQENFTDEYISKLTELYTNNFDKNIEDIAANKETYQLSTLYIDFSVFIEERLCNSLDHRELALSLLQLCKRNKFIQKISASNVYVNKINDRKIQRFLNIKKKIFIDTPIALYAICYYFKTSSDYDNFYYKTSKKLIELAREENLTLYISERYIWEIANHFRDAFRLIPFSNIIQDHKLGNSKNVFYNFYLYLKNNENYSENFDHFINQFGIRENSSKESYNSHINNFLSNLNVKEQIIEKEYEILELNQLFENYLRKNFKTKTNFAKNCDSIMFAFLADSDVEVHNLEPLFLTWDKSFNEIHKEYTKDFPNSQKWLNISPNKYIDSNSLLKFSINNETLTDNLLALISDDIVMNTHSLIDSLALILNPNDEVGLEIAHRLANLREEEINKIATSEIHIPENFEGEAIIDDVVFNITDHYKTTDKFTEFKRLFTNKDLIDNIIELINKCKDDIYEHSELDLKVFEQFDELISKNIN